MTILFVSHYAGFYGAAKSLYALMLDLRERYNIVPLVLLPSGGPICRHLDEAGIKYFIAHYYWWVNYNHGLYQYLLNKRKQWINFFCLRSICKLLPVNEIDLVYTNSVTVNIGFLLAKRLGKPHIWQFRESLSQFNLSLSLSLSKRILKDVTNCSYILISDYMVRYFQHLLPSERVHRIYNGIALPQRVRDTNDMKDGVLKLCMVGVLNEQKNQMDALKAVHIIRQTSEVNVQLYLIGAEVEEYKKQLNDYVNANHLKENVIFVGHSDHVYDWLERMNIGIMASHDEAFGRVTVEYMSHLMPVIASNSGANTELIVEGENGFIYNIYQASELADKLLYFWRNPQELDRMGKRARQLVEQYYTIEKNTDLIYQQIQKTLH